MLFKIVSRWDKQIIYEREAESLEHALEAAVSEGVSLQGAKLTGADLGGADLKEADLEEADLEGASLEKANLMDTNLERANLIGVRLEGANLIGVRLEGASLEGASLIHAGARSDGHPFYAHMCDGVLWVRAGVCRYFSIADARKHWQETRGGTQLGNESQAILDHAERLARIRGWLE